MVKLMELEWRKLEQKKVIGEVVIYWMLLMFLPVFFLKVVFADMPEIIFANSYADMLKLMLPMQLGFVLFGASMINHVFIEPYKNKTMALSFGYPISRKKLFVTKALFVAAAVFICTVVSFVLSGITTYVLDLTFDIIGGTPTAADLMMYAVRTITHSIVVALISLIPLFGFGIWRRAVVPLIVCAIFLMQFPTFLSILRISLNQDILYAILSLLGAASVYMSVKLANQIGDV
ncbi:ABC transporter permease [Paenibacillus sp. strain BS8-2]